MKHPFTDVAPFFPCRCYVWWRVVITPVLVIVLQEEALRIVAQVTIEAAYTAACARPPVSMSEQVRAAATWPTYADILENGACAVYGCMWTQVRRYLDVESTTNSCTHVTSPCTARVRHLQLAVNSAVYFSYRVSVTCRHECVEHAERRSGENKDASTRRSSG